MRVAPPPARRSSRKTAPEYRLHLRRLLTVLIACALATPATLGAEEDPTGLQWAVLPAFKGSKDVGLVYGAQLLMIDYGTGEDDPFRWELRLKLSHSTTNRHHHVALFDTPTLLPFGLRYAVEVEALHIADANYFGIGNEAPGVDEDPASTQFRLTEPRVQMHVRRKLYAPVFVVGGVTFAHSAIDAPPGSRLARDQPDGWDGSTALAGIVGAGIDTRDHEIVPRNGVFVELYSRFALTPLSDASWFAAGAYQSAYWSPVDWIVLGQRVMFEALGGTPPLTELMRIGGTHSFRGLGGVYSHRGYAENRFIGANKGLANFEIRGYFPPLFGHLVLGAGPFVDVSRIFDGSGNLWKSWNFSSGGEFTVNWKESFVFRLDYAVSPEGGEFYFESRHMF